MVQKGSGCKAGDTLRLDLSLQHNKNAIEKGELVKIARNPVVSWMLLPCDLEGSFSWQSLGNCWSLQMQDSPVYNIQMDFFPYSMQQGATAT